MFQFHIIVAFISLITASLAAFRPTKQKFIITYTATAGTLVSGILLMVIESVSLVRVCVSGGIYLVAVVALILIARKKVASAPLY